MVRNRAIHPTTELEVLQAIESTVGAARKSGSKYVSVINAMCLLIAYRLTDCSDINIQSKCHDQTWNECLKWKAVADYISEHNRPFERKERDKETVCAALGCARKIGTGQNKEHLESKQCSRVKSRKCTRKQTDMGSHILKGRADM